jgi:hypothetical protein
MRNATQVRELLGVIEEQRGIVQRYEGHLYLERREEELQNLLEMYDELAGLVEEDLEG